MECSCRQINNSIYLISMTKWWCLHLQAQQNAKVSMLTCSHWQWWHACVHHGHYINLQHSFFRSFGHKPKDNFAMMMVRVTICPEGNINVCLSNFTAVHPSCWDVPQPYFIVSFILHSTTITTTFVWFL